MFLIREPTASGVYYSADKGKLLQDLEASFSEKDGPGFVKERKLKAVVVPHDRMHLCGHVAAWSYSRTPRTNYVILGPNVEGLGEPVSVMREGLWKTPLGEISVDSATARRLLDKSKGMEFDVRAHRSEHSIEVQLPFLQYRFGNEIKILPITVTDLASEKNFVERCKEVAKSIADMIRSSNSDWTIVAAANLTTGEKRIVEKNDKTLISSVKSLNTDKLSKSVTASGMVPSGYGSLLVAMHASKILGAKKGELLKYSTSYKVARDKEDVTGYASIIIS